MYVAMVQTCIARVFHLYRLQELFFWCKLNAHRRRIYSFPFLIAFRLMLADSCVKVRLPIRDTRQKFFALCLFYFTVHRSRENLRNPPTFTYCNDLSKRQSQLPLETLDRHRTRE